MCGERLSMGVICKTHASTSTCSCWSVFCVGINTSRQVDWAAGCYTETGKYDDTDEREHNKRTQGRLKNKRRDRRTDRGRKETLTTESWLLAADERKEGGGMDEVARGLEETKKGRTERKVSLKSEKGDSVRWINLDTDYHNSEAQLHLWTFLIGQTILSKEIEISSRLCPFVLLGSSSAFKTILTHNYDQKLTHTDIPPNSASFGKVSHQVS